MFQIFSDKTGYKEYKKGIQFYEQKDYTLSIESLEQSATNGYIEANFMLGKIYFDGIGIDKNYRKALEWFTIYERLVENDPKAQYYIGRIFYKGDGDTLVKDNEKAFLWLDKSSKNENADAQLILGLMYLKGEGVERNSRRAHQWFEKSFMNGNKKAEFQLGFCYQYGINVEKNLGEALRHYKEYTKLYSDGNAYNSMGDVYRDGGYGVDKDCIKAIKYYKEADDSGFIKSAIRIGSLYFEGNGVQKDFKTAFKWFTKYEVLVNNDGDTQYYIGQIYYHGDGDSFKKDVGKSYVYTLTAAKNGNSDAQLLVGLMYLNGEFVKKNYKNAFFWFDKAYKSKNKKAQFHLAYCYQNGIGVDKDPGQALGLYENYLKENEDGVAYFNVGDLYRERGTMNEKDYLKAIDYYQKAVKNKCIMGLSKIALLYLNGEGVERNYKKAFDYFSEAANRNDSYAMYNLGKMYYHGQHVEQDYDKALDLFVKSSKLPNSEQMEDIKSYISKIRDIKKSSNDGGLVTDSQKITEENKVNYKWLSQQLDVIHSHVTQNSEHDQAELLLLISKIEIMHTSIKELISEDTIATLNLYSLTATNKPNEQINKPNEHSSKPNEIMNKPNELDRLLRSKPSFLSLIPKENKDRRDTV